MSSRVNLRAQIRLNGSSVGGETRRILAFPKRGNLYPEMLYEHLEAQGISVVDGVWTLPWLLRNVRSGDLIHIHWLSFLYFQANSKLHTYVRLARLFVLLLFAKARGATIVWTVHNLYPHDAGHDLRIHRQGRRIITALADYVCAHGASAASIVSREFGVARSRVRIGHHGHFLHRYPNELTRAEARARLNVTTEEFLYLFIGQCRPYKGLEDLIVAFAQAPRPCRLIIAGNFLSQQYLEDVKSLVRMVADIDLVPGYIPDEELQVYLNAAECVVLPYRAVLTSGAALLALSFGRPVIAPDLGSMRDYIDPGCGLLFPAAEPGGLAHALCEIRSRRFDPDEIKRRAGRFSWSEPARVLVDILNQ